MATDFTVEGIYEFQNEYMHLVVDDSAKLLYSAWVRKPTSDEYREATNIFMEHIQEKEIKFWVQDLGQLGELPVQDLEWVLDELIPKAIASDLQKIARVSLEDKNMEMFLELANEILAEYKTNIQVHEFQTYREAVAWIEGEDL